MDKIRLKKLIKSIWMSLLFGILEGCTVSFILMYSNKAYMMKKPDAVSGISISYGLTIIMGIVFLSSISIIFKTIKSSINDENRAIQYISFILVILTVALVIYFGVFRYPLIH